MDPVTFGILDVTTYIANMSDPDFHSSKGPTWTKYYSAKEAYGPLVVASTTDSDEKEVADGEVAELTPAFWHNVTEVLQHNSTAFTEFLARKRRGWHASGDENDDDDGDNKCASSEECVSAEICRLRGARSQDNCAHPGSRLGRVGLNGRMAGMSIEAWRRDFVAHGMMDQCEVSVVRDTLAAVGVVVRALAGR